MDYTIRVATPKDGPAMAQLLPRLAAFTLPKNRNPEDTFSGDGKMLNKWMQGEISNAFVYLAEDSKREVLGWSYVSMQPEFMSTTPGAHLEVILVAEHASGQGIGKALLHISQTEAKQRGAESMTLHVWETNTHAQSIYEKDGFDSELKRYIKWLK